MAWATNKEHGMLTTHFWGPVANWGLVGSAVYDASFQGPEVRSAAYFLTTKSKTIKQNTGHLTSNDGNTRCL